MKIAVGISGGVDSAVTALLLKERGDELIGVTMVLGRENEDASLKEAQEVAKCIGIPLKVYDLSAMWKREVIDYLKATYLQGRTPNPCVRCNEMVKFGLLPQFAFNELGCEYFATGHYARLEGGRLFRGVDYAKDQSYFLYRVDKEILKRTLLPLGGMKKSEVREIADRAGLTIAKKEDSQDFCGGEPKTIIGAAPKEGNIVTVESKTLGRHQGFWNYTVGKRKGLGIGGGTPYYVVRLDAERNEVVVGFREQAIAYDLEVESPIGRIDKNLPVKVRSAGEPKLLKDGIMGVAKGQSAVFYDGDEVVGGGIIV